MIDKKKLHEFLTNRHAEASKVCDNSAGAEYYYQLGQANATAAIISKLNSGQFEIREGDKHV